MRTAARRRAQEWAAVAALLVGAAVGVSGLASTGPADAATARAASGRSLFVADCASCHTLRAAHARGTAGPNLDRRFRRVPAARVRRIVRRAIVRGDGAMPAGILTGHKVDVVAAYVARVAGR